MNPIEINVNVTISAPELVGAFNSLVDTLKAAKATTAGVPQQQSFSFEEKAEKEQKQVDTAIQKLNERKEKVTKQPEPPAETKQESNQPDTETEYTLEDVRAAIGKVSNDKGKEVARGILDTLGVKSVSNLQPEQFSQAMQMAKEA